MRLLLAALLLVVTVVTAQAYDRRWASVGAGCPNGHKPGEDFDLKPGCAKCHCFTAADRGHYCRLCGDRGVDMPDLPGYKKEARTDSPYPACCYPNYVRV